MITRSLTLSFIFFSSFVISHPKDYIIDSDYDHDLCGVSRGKRSKRHESATDYIDSMQMQVQGGSNAEKGEHPWATFINFKVPSMDRSEICTGTLISRRHVVTAAHCIWTKEVENSFSGFHFCANNSFYSPIDIMKHSTVHYGGLCIQEGKEGCTKEMVMRRARISKMTIFPFFEGGCRSGSDLLLLTLNREIRDVPHACLLHLHGSNVKRNTKFTTFGFGADAIKGLDHHNRLQTISLGLKLDNCAETSNNVSPDILCYRTRHTETICRGDSGAGLMSRIDKRQYLIGLLSFGGSCETKKESDQSFTDIRLFSATIDKELKTIPPYPTYVYSPPN